ncbi:MAG: MmgE/PrpD family protein [Pseudomonadota bacterium]
MDNYLKLLSEYTANLEFSDFNESTILAVKHRVIDSLGCALGAYFAEPCKIARRLCFSTDSPLTARVVGSLSRTSPEMAAFANTIMVRYLDFNDAYRMKDAGHPSDAIPAILAIGEAIHAEGKNLIEAIVLAYEIQCRMIEEVLLDKNGWDQPVYLGLGTALSVGKLMGLNKEQLSNAAALALVPNVALYQSRVGELSMWKAGAAGMAVRQGIFAATMAREGMTGPEEAFEGKFGLINQVTGPFKFEPFGGKDKQFGIERSNLKTYPVRDSIQLFIKTALDLGKKVSQDQVRSLLVKTYASSYRTAVEPRELWKPKTRETADHSIPFCIAAALIDGDVTAETFSRERFRDSDVLDLISRMEVKEDPEFTSLTPGKRNARIEATTHSGEVHVAHRIVTAEDLQTGWSDKEVEGKYLKLVQGMLTPAQTRASLDLLWGLEDIDDAARILDHLEV